MNKKIAVILLMFFTGVLFGQGKKLSGIEVTGGMGIEMAYTPVLTNYINNNYGIGSSMNTFNNSVELWVEGVTDYRDKFQIGAEFAYSYFSYTNGVGGLIYEFDKAVYMPTLLGYYVIKGYGYEFKFGVGIGYRHAVVTEKVYASQDYSANGFGSLLRVQAITGLMKNLYVNLGGDLRYDVIGAPKNGNLIIYDNVLEQNVTLNSFGAVVRIGLTYIF